MNFMFDLEDASNDGAIDAAEFAIVCSSYGLDKTECEDAFRKMSQVIMFDIKKDVKIPESAFVCDTRILIDNPSRTQGAEEVTREQFAVLWQEFWQSDEPSAPGNFIFGKTTF